MAETTLKEKTARGLLWGGISNGAQQLLNLLFGIFLARLLCADDYGMVGLLTVFSLVAGSLQESGFTAALANKKEATHRDYNAVFWFNVGLGSLLYLLLFLAAPLIARFYGQPGLVPLARYVFLGFLVSSFGIAHNAYLFRHLMARQRAIASLLAISLSGCTGVALAWMGYSYWGIATQTLVFIATLTACYWHFSPWRPTWPVDFSPLRPLFPFSVKLLLTNIFNHLNNNLLTVTLGRLYPAGEVGYYNQACKWSGMGQQTLLGMINGVAQPVLAKAGAGGGDEERLTRVFRKMLRFAAFVSFPALLGLGFVAQELVTVAVTDKWLPSVPSMQLMCVYGAFVPVVAVYQQLVISRGRSGVFMGNTIAEGLAILAAVLLAHPYGIRTMVAAYVAVNVGWLPVWHALAWRGLRFSLWRALADIAPYLLATVAVLAATHFALAGVEGTWTRLLGKIALAAALYTGLMAACGSSTFREAAGYLLKRKKRQPGTTKETP